MPYMPASSSSPEPQHRCITRCLAALPPHAPPRRQLYRSMAASQTLLAQIYDSGAPLFTRAALADLAAQIDAAVADPTQQPMRVTGLDGKVVAFPLLTGRAHHIDDAHICVLNAARLLDACRDDTLYHPIRAHLPLEIAHIVEKRLAVPPPPPRRFLDDRLPVAAAADDDENDANSLRLRLHTCRARSPHHTLLRALLSALPPRIRNIVALACGRPKTMMTTAMAGRRSVTQHALMLALRDVLGGGVGGGVACVAQDAGYYTVIDKTVLEGERVAVVDDPRGYLEVGDETVVVAVWPGNVPVWDVVCDVARPAVLVWHQDAERPGNQGECGDPASSRVRNMLRDDYVKVSTPPENDWLDEVAIYIRKEK
ncbi:uncharacterized protein BBA_00144 [Beauveria bassiana ARSEF 2860]|uniref:SRR1-like domain-containing protein n=1 Tax=Beauveria bassiana (strain ARSEF 2860) TaxID=655819 RepID=J4KR85_BEAB2|nr:uncharacterized protein BBA_00144 [Beauveria bassiana ARSEF 2860]EJP70514.1 hypothetical protein BBA_00144 [Beauveria bassiana ARSEF 2860]